jgi:hypothetical protein
MKRYREIQEIMQTENPEFNLLWEADELIRQNLYIVTAQEEGLSRYEKILGIYPDPNDDFETRRIRIITRWNDFTPYTLKYLIGLLSVLTKDNFEIRTNFTEYEIDIIVTLTASGAVNDLAYILKQIIPCNLTVISKNEINVNVAGALWIAAALKETITYIITNDIRETYAAHGYLSGGLALVHSNLLTKTNDFDADYSADGKLNGGSTLVQSTVKLVTNDFDGKYTVNGKINGGSTVSVSTIAVVNTK